MNLSGESGPPLFVTYLDTVFAGSIIDAIQIRYSRLRSNDVTEIHEGYRSGVFNITKLGQDYIEMKNDRPINLIPGSRINLIGDLGFFVANSDELRFYPSNKIPVDVAPEVAPDMELVSDTPVVPVNTTGARPSDTIKKTPAIQFVVTIMIFQAAYIFRRKIYLYRIYRRKYE